MGAEKVDTLYWLSFREQDGSWTDWCEVTKDEYDRAEGKRDYRRHRDGDPAAPAQPTTAVGEAVSRCSGYCCPACGRCYDCHKPALECNGTHPTPTQPATAVGEAVAELSMLASTLIQRLRKAAPDDAWIDKAWRILSKHGHGSLLRDASPTPPTLHTAPDAGDGEASREG